MPSAKGSYSMLRMYSGRDVTANAGCIALIARQAVETLPEKRKEWKDEKSLESPSASKGALARKIIYGRGMLDPSTGRIRVVPLRKPPTNYVHRNQQKGNVGKYTIGYVWIKMRRGRQSGGQVNTVKIVCFTRKKLSKNVRPSNPRCGGFFGG